MPHLPQPNKQLEPAGGAARPLPTPRIRRRVANQLPQRPRHRLRAPPQLDRGHHDAGHHGTWQCHGQRLSHQRTGPWLSVERPWRLLGTFRRIKAIFGSGLFSPPHPGGPLAKPLPHPLAAQAHCHHLGRTIMLPLSAGVLPPRVPFSYDGYSFPACLLLLLTLPQVETGVTHFD